MVRQIAFVAASVGLVAAPLAAAGISRDSQPVNGESGLKGQGTIFFLAAIAVTLLAVVFLPEDQPASP